MTNLKAKTIKIKTTSNMLYRLLFSRIAASHGFVFSMDQAHPRTVKFETEARELYYRIVGEEFEFEEGP